MENSFNDRNFERLVQQNADQFRMFPSEKVWKGIHTALHKRRRWYGIGLALLLLTTGTVTLVMLVPGDHNSQLAELGRSASLYKAAEPATKAPVITYVAAPKTNTSNSTSQFPTQLEKTYLNEQDASISSNEDEMIALTENNLVRTETSLMTAPVSRNNNALDHNGVIPPTAKISPVIRKSGKDITPVPADQVLVNSAKDNASITDNKSGSKIKAEEQKKAEERLLFPPYTIESVINSYSLKKSRKKLEWQLYVTPTISYRTLTENTEFISAARYNSIMAGGTPPVYYSTDVNSVVEHKPDLGLQVGIRAAYPLSKWFSFTGGFQFSVSKYDIKASEHSSEMATIALTTRNTLSTMTNYRNEDGAKENWLRNFYFSASVPIGMELKLSDGSRNYFGVATTLQPTFVIDNRAYLITTDYKNYAEVPSLTRKFNMNTSFEIFSAHTTGKVHWRIGPQVHYQMMSSFTRNYPIKEHLFDFGLKLGVQLK